MNPDVERIWVWARNRHGNELDNRYPSAGIRAVLVALLDEQGDNVTELARRAGQDQGNTSTWLRKLRQWEFAELEFSVNGVGGGIRERGDGGGRPAQYWRLTRAGRELAGLLVEEVAAPEVLAICPCGNPIFRDPKRRGTSAREQSRKFCSRTCGGTYGGGLAVKAPEVIGTCPCGTAIMRNPSRSRWSERNRKYCSRACSADARRGLPFPGKPRARKAAPQVEPERPVWRPPGWAAVPQVGRRG